MPHFFRFLFLFVKRITEKCEILLYNKSEDTG